MGGSSSVFLTEDLANKLSTKSIKEFYAFENECIDGQLSIAEMHELFSKKYDELLFKDTEDHSMKPGMTKQTVSNEKLRTRRLTRRITSLNRRGWGTDAAAIAHAELRAEVNERYSKVSKTAAAVETKHKPAPSQQSISPSKGSGKKDKGSQIIGRTFGSLSTPSLIRNRLVPPPRQGSPSAAGSNPGSRNAIPLRQVRTKQEQAQSMNKSRSTRSTSSLADKGMINATSTTTTASSPSSRVTTAECARRVDSESDMSDGGGNTTHNPAIERCTSASSDESGTSGFFSESDDEETLAGLTFLSKDNKEKEAMPAWRRRLSAIPEHFECRLCRKIFNSQSMLDTHVQHSQIHRQAVLEQRRRYAAAFAETERLQKLLRFTVQRFQETLQAQRAYREGSISLSRLLRWQRAIGRVIASFATKKFHAIISDLDEQRRRAEAPQVAPAVWLHTTTRFFWRVKARFGVTAYFHPTQRCLEIVAQLLVDDESAELTEEKMIQQQLAIMGSSSKTKNLNLHAINTEKKNEKKKENPVQRIFLDVAQLIDLDNKRTAHHLTLHRQLMLQSFDDNINNNGNHPLALASVDSIDSTLGPTAVGIASSSSHQQQQQQFLRRGSLDSLSIADGNNTANDDFYVVPEQAHRPHYHQFTEDATPIDKDDYVPDRMLVKEVLHRIKADYAAVADGDLTVDQCLYFDASKYITSPVLPDSPKDIITSESLGAFKVYRQDEVREKLQQVLQHHQLLSEAVEKAEEFSTRASEAIDRSSLEDQLIVIQQTTPKSPSSPYTPSRGPKRRPGLMA